MAFSDAVKKYFEPAPGKVRVRDVAREATALAEKGGKGVVKDLKKAGKFAKEFGQGTARAYMGTALGAMRASEAVGRGLVPPPEESVKPSYTPRTRVEKAIFGTDKEITPEGVGAEWGFDEGGAVAPIVGSLGGAVDAIPGGKAAKEVTKRGIKSLGLADDAVEMILKSDSVTDIRSILKRSKAVDADVISAIAPQLKTAKTRAEADKIIDALKDRGFMQSVRESLPETGERLTASYRTVRDTDELAIKAKNFVKDDLDGAEALVKNNTGEDAVAVASELIKKYSDDAAKATTKAEADIFYQKASDVAVEISEKLTQLGRDVQAAIILSRTTPEGQLTFAARTIQNFNKANPFKKIPELSADDANFILREHRRIQGMEDGWEKAKAFKDLQNFTLDKIPTPLWHKIATIWQAGLLTGIKTTGLNLASTANNIIGKNVSKVPAVIVDSVASLFTGKRSVALTPGVTMKGLKTGFDNGWRYFKTGYDERDIATAYDRRRVNFGKGVAGRLARAYTETIFRTLGAQDQFFYYGAMAGSIREQAVVRAMNNKIPRSERKAYIDFWVQNPDEEMVTAATIDALSATFQNKTKLGEALSGAREGMGAFGTFVIPFARTPSAVAMEVIHYSPVGALEAAYEAIKKGEFDQRKFSTLLGKSSVGTAGAMWLGYQLQGDDKVALEYPKTPRERAMWEAENRKPNSIKIGGKWRSPYVLGPNGVLILWGAHFKRALEQSGSPTKAIVDASFGMGKSFLEQTAMTGVNQLAEALNNPQEAGEAYVAGLVSSFAPTLLSDIARATDTMERNTKGDSFAESVGNRVVARIPEARKTLEPKVDAYGYDVERIGNFFEVMADPTRPYPAIEAPVLEEIRRLWEAGQPVAPTKLKKYGVLTDQESTDLWRLSGTKVEENLTELFEEKKYRLADDEQRGKMVQNEVTRAHRDARAIIVKDLTQGMSKRERDERLKQFEEAGLLTRDVKARYEDIR